jgi:hypothetical protein
MDGYRGEGTVAKTKAVGDGSLTLTVSTTRSGLIDVHESWCQLVDPQPAPVCIPLQGSTPEVEEAVIEEIRKRRDVGRKKYQTSMERTDLSVEEWIQHAKEEALDFAIYLEKLKREVGQTEDSIKLSGTEGLGTFGGEDREQDFAEYGLDLGKVHVHGLTPAQAIQLACTLVDHLVRNGHDFELRQHTHQDQYKALVCIDGERP